MQIYAKVRLGGMRINALLSHEVMKGIGKVTFPSCLGHSLVDLNPDLAFVVTNNAIVKITVASESLVGRVGLSSAVAILGQACSSPAAWGESWQ